MSNPNNWFVAVKRYPARLWLRLCALLDDRAAKHQAAWAETLEHKRRYTSPDEAMRQRVPPGKDQDRKPIP